MSDQIMKASTSSEGASTQVAVGRVTAERERAKAIALRRRFPSNLLTGLIYVYLVIMVVFALFPIYYVVQASLAGGQNLYTTDLKLLPANPTFDNYIYAFTQLPLLNWIANTFFICTMTTLIGLAFSVTGAYALSRFRIRGRDLSLNLLLAIQAFPGLLALTAYYVLLNKLGLLNTLVGLVVIYAGGSLVFGTWNMKGYFDTLPAGRAGAGRNDRWGNPHPGFLACDAAAGRPRPGRLGTVHVHRWLERVRPGKSGAQLKRCRYQSDLRARSLHLAERFPHAMGLLRRDFRGCLSALDHFVPVHSTLLQVRIDHW